MAFKVRIIDSTDDRRVSRLIARRTRRHAELTRRVATIVDRVRRGGDAALVRYARRFDKLTKPIEVTREEMRAASRDLPRELRRAISIAAANIRRVAVRQLPGSWSVRPARGVHIAQRVLPLDSVGCYVPGGRYPLPSSLLML